jgi:hypothetical protein
MRKFKILGIQKVFVRLAWQKLTVQYHALPALSCALRRNMAS